jgi:hypothetical protein
VVSIAGGDGWWNFLGLRLASRGRGARDLGLDLVRVGVVLVIFVVRVFAGGDKGR